MNVPIARLIRRRRPAAQACAVCGEPLGLLPLLRIRGVAVHRDCLGYRARQQLRGARRD